jgi:hypothetical protein
MNNSERLKILMESGRTVFTPLDLRMLWRVNALNAKISVVRMVEKGLVVRWATGYYTLNDRYNRYCYHRLRMNPPPTEMRTH